MHFQESMVLVYLIVIYSTYSQYFYFSHQQIYFISSNLILVNTYAGLRFLNIFLP